MKKYKGKVLKYIGIVLFVTMMVLIYLVSPKITAEIQNIAKFIYEIDSNYITRIVELILAVSLILTVFMTKKK
ncbi:MAG: hypothetical protein IKM97_04795 [Clostridia bacterium]|nr:hypothetical protein [Clostridia bacterium]